VRQPSRIEVQQFVIARDRPEDHLGKWCRYGGFRRRGPCKGLKRMPDGARGLAVPSGSHAAHIDQSPLLAPREPQLQESARPFRDEADYGEAPALPCFYLGVTAGNADRTRDADAGTLRSACREDSRLCNTSDLAARQRSGAGQPNRPIFGIEPLDVGDRATARSAGGFGPKLTRRGPPC
jgi:hypothetical protein